MNGDLGKAPRWFLLILLTAVTGLATWQTTRWVAHVEGHIDGSGSGYERIAALEARVAALEQHAAWCRRAHREANGH